MSHEILDQEDFKEKVFNYQNPTIIYLSLMVIIGMLMTKIMFQEELTYLHLLVGAFTYFLIAFIISLIQELLTTVYYQIRKLERNRVHPIWFRLLEATFYIWSIILILTFVGNKII